MASLPPPRGRGQPRTRRWDAVVLGGALPGLVTAIILGQRGARVLVLEEEAAARVLGLGNPHGESFAILRARNLRALTSAQKLCIVLPCTTSY